MLCKDKYARSFFHAKMWEVFVLDGKLNHFALIIVE